MKRHANDIFEVMAAGIVIMIALRINTSRANKHFKKGMRNEWIHLFIRCYSINAATEYTFPWSEGKSRSSERAVLE